VGCLCYLVNVYSFVNSNNGGLCPAGSLLTQGLVLQEFVEKACLRLMKILVEVQSTHPYSFSNLAVLPPVLEFCYAQIAEPKERSVVFEPFLIKCTIFVRSVIQCVAYRPNKAGRVVGQTTPTMEETKGTLARQAEEILLVLLGNQRLVLLCGILVRRSVGSLFVLPSIRCSKYLDSYIAS
jgi:hypothetical protein